MRDKDIKKLEQENGVTYVSGLGFVEPQNKHTLLSDIRKYSTMICLVIFIYMFCVNLFYLPAIYFADLVGFDIEINHYTGLIMTTPVSDAVIQMFVKVGSLLVANALAYFFCARGLTTSQFLCRPARGSMSVAIPIVLATGITASYVVKAVSEVCEWLGIICPSSSTIQVSTDSGLTIGILVTTIVVCLFEELLFRGLILFSLRIFGDGFAIIITAGLFAIFKQNVLDIICWFFISLVICYFTLRAGSMLVAVVCRIALILLGFAGSVLEVYIDSELAFVITCLISLFVLLWAALAYIRELKYDKESFTVKPIACNTSLVKRVGAFCGSWVFITLVAATIFTILFTLQFIG